MRFHSHKVLHPSQTDINFLEFTGPVIESDDEYDSEMDDFIDDSEANFDISSQISQIFGYDRSK